MLWGNVLFSHLHIYPRGLRELFAKQLVDVKSSVGSNPAMCAKKSIYFITQKIKVRRKTQYERNC